MKKRYYILIFVAVLVFLFVAQGIANQRGGGKNKYKEALKFVEPGNFVKLLP